MDIKTQFTIWIILWLILVIISITSVAEIGSDCTKYVTSVWNHTTSECDEPGPMLLSRAITTLLWARISAVLLSLISIFFITLWKRQHKIKMKWTMLPLVAAFLLFASAFVANMFKSELHGVLIGLGSILAIVWTFPSPKDKCCRNSCYKRPKQISSFLPDTTEIWWVLWIFMILNVVVFIIWYAVDCTSQHVSCPSLRSWFYICEYFFFWSMYLIVGFAVAMEEEEIKEAPAPKRVTRTFPKKNQLF